MSAMVNLEIPWINVMSKMDLVTSNAEEPTGGARNGVRGRKNIARYVPLAPYDSILSYALFSDTTCYNFAQMTLFLFLFLSSHL
jgi:hypothetical protein